LACTLFVVAYAGYAPYLGGDIQDLIESTKTAPGSSTVPGVKKPVTEKQRRDSTNYNAKFADIARAYAEGYKAAIKAVQARAFIAKRRLLGIRPRSNIPGLVYRNPYLEKVAKSIIPATPSPLLRANGGQQADILVPKSTIPVPDNVHTQISSNEKGSVTMSSDDKRDMVTKSIIPPAPETLPIEKKSEIPSIETFSAPVPFTDSKEIDNAVEKSNIPQAPMAADTPHTIKERSAPVHYRRDFIVREDHPAFISAPVKTWSEEERNKIAKLNARARHRNVYFDGNGGDPFRGGGVLSTQNAINKKHRRRRRRRSVKDGDSGRIYYAPAHEQSFDNHYHIRHRRSHMPYLGQNLDAIGVVRAVPKSWTNPQKKNEAPKRIQAFAAPVASEAAYFQPMPMDPARFTQFMAPSFRASIPQPSVSPLAMQAMLPPQLAMNYAAMFGNPPPNSAMFGNPPPNFQSFRSMVPGYPAFMPGPFGYLPAPLPSGINEASPLAETKSSDSHILVKKSTIPHAQEASATPHT